MMDLAAVLIDLCPGRSFTVGSTYESIVSMDGGAVPSRTELEQAWPRVEAKQHNENAKAQRHTAFVAEADPLYMKWQAGEGTEAEWRAKREEIRGRHPYVDELV